MTPPDDEVRANSRADILRAFDVTEDDMQAFEDATHDYTAAKEQAEAERQDFITKLRMVAAKGR